MADERTLVDQDGAPPDAVNADPAGVLVEHVRGNPAAPITVVEYGDYECPYCAAAAPVLHELVDTSDGQVRLVFRNFPLFQIHPHALEAALAAESTTTAGVFWEMHDVLFKKQGRLFPPDLRLYAEHVGADPELATGAGPNGSSRRCAPTTGPGWRPGYGAPRPCSSTTGRTSAGWS